MIITQTATIINQVATIESLRAQLAKCSAARADLERRVLILTNERDEARAKP